MGWATQYIRELQSGKSVHVRPFGRSMQGIIESGQLCQIDPILPDTVTVGDVVLCRVGKNQFLHLVKKVKGQRYQIGNNKGRINGWVGPDDIYGKLTAILD